jgi:glutamate dehydrogenase
VLLAYAKMHCTRTLAADALCDDPFLERVLLAYFPPALVERFPAALRRHRLRRELIATTLSNDVVDLMGATFVTRAARETGSPAAAVVRAFVIVEALTGARRLAARLATAPPAAELRALELLVDAVERAARWVLETYPEPFEIGALRDRFAASVAGVLPLLSAAERDRRHQRAEELEAAGVPADLVTALLDAEGLREALDIVQVAATVGVAANVAADAYARVGAILDFGWLRRALAAAAGEDRWERRAVEGLLADLDRLRRDLTRSILAGAADLDGAVDAFCRQRARELARLRALLEDLKSGRTISLAGLMVAIRELTRLEETP